MLNSMNLSSNSAQNKLFSFHTDPLPFRKKKGMTPSLSFSWRRIILPRNILKNSDNLFGYGIIWMIFIAEDDCIAPSFQLGPSALKISMRNNTFPLTPYEKYVAISVRQSTCLDETSWHGNPFLFRLNEEKLTVTATPPFTKWNRSVVWPNAHVHTVCQLLWYACDKIFFFKI